MSEGPDPGSLGDETIAATMAGSATGEGGRPPAKEVVLGRGQSLGRYLILSPLGAGGMGTVYVAHDPELDRKVALKVLRRAVTGDTHSDDRARLLREAQALARLSHQNVVAVFDAGTHEGQVWLAMELVDGVTLKAWWSKTSRTWREILDVMRPVLRGVAAIHKAGLVHRDLKPDNVMVDESGRVRVMDLGLARAQDASGLVTEPVPMASESSDPGISTAMSGRLSQALTQAGALLGTPAYMAPEQWAGDEAGPPADQFALAVMIWEGVYGRRPFVGDNPAALALAVTSGKLEEPASGRGPRWLRAVLERALAVDPERRWPSLTAFQAALDQGQRRARFRVGAIAVAVIGGLGGGAFAWERAEEAEVIATCEEESRVIEEAWPGVEGEMRARMESAFADSELVYASDNFAKAKQRLDGYVEDWSRVSTETCRSARLEGSLEDAAHERRRACLAQSRWVLHGLVGALAEADASLIQNAIPALSRLPRIESCTDDQWLALAPAFPDDLEFGQRAAQVKRDLARAWALWAAAKFSESLELSEQALEQAESLEWAPLIGEARLRAGIAAEATGDLPRAEEHETAGYFGSLAAGDTRAASNVATQLVWSVGHRRAKYEEGLAWGRHAEALLSRLPERADFTRANLHGYLGQVYQDMGRTDEALREQEQALELRRRILGDRHPNVATSLNSIGILYWRAGELDAASERYRQALPILEEAYGELHPETNAVVLNLGLVHAMRGDYERAVELVGKSHRNQEKVLGPDHPRMAVLLLNLGELEHLRGNPSGAREYLTRALEIREHKLGPDHPGVAVALEALGNLDLEAGELDEATAQFERALAIRRDKLEANHPEIFRTEAGLAAVELARGDSAAARKRIEAAFAATDEAKVSPPELARAQFVRAQALWDTGGDRARAIELAESAVATFTELGRGVEQYRAPAEKWLVERKVETSQENTVSRD